MGSEKSNKRKTVAWIVGCATALLASVGGCASGSFSARAKTPVGEGGVEWTSGGQPLTFVVTGDEETNGLCLGVVFKDANMTPIGNSSGKIPFAGSQPPGAATVCWEVTEPSESNGSPIGLAGVGRGNYRNAHDALIPFGLSTYSFLEQPLQPDVAQGIRATSMDVFAESLGEARSIAGGISAFGLWAPIGPEVRINQYLHAIQDASGTSILVTIADDNPFTSMSLEVHTDDGSFAANIAQAFLSQGNGWHTATFVVPVDDLDINYTLGSTNTIFMGVSYQGPLLDVTEYEATWEFALTAFP